jgi:hypothetical protein
MRHFRVPAYLEEPRLAHSWSDGAAQMEQDEEQNSPRTPGCRIHNAQDAKKEILVLRAPPCSLAQRYRHTYEDRA